MTNAIGTPVHTNYDNTSNHGASGEDNLGKHIQRLLSKGGFAGDIELSQNSDGRISVANAHPQKAEIEKLLNSDKRLGAMLGRSAPESDTAEHDPAANEPGTYYESPHGDSIFISDTAQEAMTRHKSNYLGSIEAEDRSLEAYLHSPAWQEYTNSLAITDKELELRVNYNWYSSKGENRSTGFNSSENGMMWFANGLGMNMPIRSGTSMIEEGKKAVVQESDVLNSASDSRKQVFRQLESAMKSAGIQLKTGQKVDFIMDEKGAVKVDPKSLNDKELAAKIEAVINNDKSLGSSFMDHLAKSAATSSIDPASMKIHVDSILQEYTGKSFDNLEWDSSGNLIIPEGMENAVDEYGGIGYLVGHLKSLQESEGEDIFKKEFSFSVTGSGIIDNDMSARVSSNLFKSNKMYQNNSVYTKDSTSNSWNATIASSKEMVGDYWKMDSLDKMFQEKGTTVYLAGDGSESYAIDANGNRKELPYKSENYNAAAKYLIEDYLIENGIRDDISNYTLKITSKGNYEVVHLSEQE